MEAARLNLRLFIDGYEVPVIGARCTFTEGGPANAEIQLIATDALFSVQPRAVVMLYYYHSGAEGLGLSGEPKLGAYDPRMYKLLFMGEMVAMSFSKVAQGQRMASLRCIDPSNYLDAIKQHSANTSRGGLAAIENVFLGVNMGESTSNTATSTNTRSNIEDWITSAPKVDGKYSLSNGIQRVLRELFFVGNIFYSKQFNKLRIGDCVVGLRDDKTSSNLMNLKYFKRHLKETIAQGGAFMSARGMLETLMSPILFNTVTIPCPKFDSTGAVLGMKSAEIDDTGLKEVIHQHTARAGAALNYILIKPDSWFFPAPKCNLFFPHMYDSFSFSRNYVAEPTRMIMRTEEMMRPIQGRGTSAVLSAEGTVISPAVPGKWYQRRHLNARLYAPDFEGFNLLLERSSSGGGTSARMNEILLGHEAYVGPSTMFTFAGSLGKYVSNKARREYLSFFTDYYYWKVRFGARGGQIRMAFNPNAVPGFPGVVFDSQSSISAGPKHFVGQVEQVVHSITQSGGTTDVSMIGMRPFDEDVDFDFQMGTRDSSRTFEEVVLGTLAGGDATKETFYDERYHADNIGKEVYDKILGTESILELYDELINSKEVSGLSAALSSQTKSQRTSIEAIWAMYSAAVNSGAVQGFTDKLTHRPKANLVQLMGGGDINNEGDGWIQFPDQPTVSFTVSDMGDDSGAGFFAAAIDEISDDATTAKYSKKTETVSVVTSTVMQTVETRDWSRWGMSSDVMPPGVSRQVPVTKTRSVKVAANTPTSYGINTDVEDRKKMVEAYVKSLLYRGLRG